MTPAADQQEMQALRQRAAMFRMVLPKKSLVATERRRPDVKQARRDWATWRRPALSAAILARPEPDRTSFLQTQSASAPGRSQNLHQPVRRNRQCLRSLHTRRVLELLQRYRKCLRLKPNCFSAKRSYSTASRTPERDYSRKRRVHSAGRTGAETACGTRTSPAVIRRPHSLQGFSTNL